MVAGNGGYCGANGGIPQEGNSGPVQGRQQAQQQRAILFRAGDWVASERRGGARGCEVDDERVTGALPARKAPEQQRTQAVSNLIST